MKKKIFVISILAILLMSTTIILMPSGNARTPLTIPTWAYISVQPNPSGVGQEAFVNFWLDKVPPTATQMWGDRWEGYMVTVTKPDGTTQKLGPFTSDAAGGAWTTYTPTTTGNYTFVFDFPGQTLAGKNPAPGGVPNAQQIGDYFQPSKSRVATLSVTDDPITYLPLNPLPTSYWSRPIFAQNNNWYSIGGNWLGAGAYNATGNFAPYTTAPNTGHIVWTKPYAPGGLIGGEFGESRMNSNYYSTAQYETKFSPIVMNGILYYTLIPGSSTSRQGWVAVDIRTGEEIWFKSTSEALLRGQLYDYVSPNQFGALSYLWDTHTTKTPNTGTTYGMYDAMTGNWILDIVNGTSATFVSPNGGYGSQGDLLGYYIDTRNWTLNLWNSSRCILLGQGAQQGFASESNWMWRPPQGASIPWALGKEWSVPMTTTMMASNGSIVNINAAVSEAAGVTQNMAIAKIADIILVTTTPGPSSSFQMPGYIVSSAYSLDDGRLLWGPLNQTLIPWTRVRAPATIGGGVYTVFTFETQEWSGYSTSTGQKLWGPTSIAKEDYPWGFYVTSYESAYGKVYSSDFNGYVHCIDLKTGHIDWEFWTGTSGYETPYGVYPLVNFQAIADGKIYVNGGHLYSPPLFRGGMVYCLNATSGDLLWSMPDFSITNGAASCIADGYFVLPNAYDNQLYSYGKGPSATEVSIQNDVITLGSKVLIRGFITDQSAGTKTTDAQARFPNGVPAISDESMSAWMQYVYMQQPKPTNATGVPVEMYVIDANGNYRSIGITTSDATGFYSFQWTPDIAGKYTVYAMFAGTESYWPSQATTAFTVDEPAATPAPTQALTSSAADTYLLPGIIGIIIAIAIVGAVLLLAIRKRS